MTGTRLRELTDRQARGTDWWDIRAAQRAASCAMMTTHSDAAAADEMDHAARQRWRRPACHALRPSFTRADYASPADHDRLDALIRAAHRHAARSGHHATPAWPRCGRRAGRACRRPTRAPAPRRHEGQNSPGPTPPTTPSPAWSSNITSRAPSSTAPRRTTTSCTGLLHRSRVPLVGQPQRLVPPQALDLQHPQRRVSSLTAGLRQANRSFTMRSQPRPAATRSTPRPSRCPPQIPTPPWPGTR